MLHWFDGPSEALNRANEERLAVRAALIDDDVNLHIFKQREPKITKSTAGTYVGMLYRTINYVYTGV